MGRVYIVSCEWNQKAVVDVWENKSIMERRNMEEEKNSEKRESGKRINM